ncbi:hypothetical protein SmJEL517_g06189 [Synchytrium microbalum]|uniref:Protein bir1 n=1 Tax=Synchytrium microbalum TaxID=1806994 RepID=A0A507BY43_9FUNG|nr:uncharacterized protein SmJEL517_g06189 [Synchytrium microbalum]TPX30193.1 hypothetical protein SmJEL517_g06189 [Synchytrium microbalum]
MKLAGYPDRFKSFGTGRGKSANKWPYTRKDKSVPKPEQLAKAGFYFTPSADAPDSCTCYLCQASVNGWTAHKDPWECHNDTCAWKLLHVNADGIGQNDVSSVEHAPDSDVMNQARLDTFGKDWWPHYKDKKWNPKPDALARAGWVYKPYEDADDATECLYCEISLDGWELNDDPVHEHKKRRPDCIIFNPPEPVVVKRPSKPHPPARLKAVKAVNAGVEDDLGDDVILVHSEAKAQKSINNEEPTPIEVKPESREASPVSAGPTRRRGRQPPAPKDKVDEKAEKSAARGRKRKAKADTVVEDELPSSKRSSPVREHDTAEQKVERTVEQVVVIEGLGEDGDHAVVAEKAESSQNETELVVSQQIEPEPIQQQQEQQKAASSSSKADVPTDMLLANWQEIMKAPTNKNKHRLQPILPPQQSTSSNVTNVKQPTKKRKLATKDRPKYRGDSGDSSSSQVAVETIEVKETKKQAAKELDPVKEGLSLKHILPRTKAVTIKEPSPLQKAISPEPDTHMDVDTARDASPEVEEDESLKAPEHTGNTPIPKKRKKLATKARPKYHGDGSNAPAAVPPLSTPIVVVKQGGKSVIKVVAPPKQKTDSDNSSARQHLELGGPPSRGKQSLSLEDDFLDESNALVTDSAEPTVKDTTTSLSLPQADDVEVVESTVKELDVTESVTEETQLNQEMALEEDKNVEQETEIEPKVIGDDIELIDQMHLPIQLDEPQQEQQQQPDLPANDEDDEMQDRMPDKDVLDEEEPPLPDKEEQRRKTSNIIVELQVDDGNGGGGGGGDDDHTMLSEVDDGVSGGDDDAIPPPEIDADVGGGDDTLPIFEENPSTPDAMEIDNPPAPIIDVKQKSNDCDRRKSVIPLSESSSSNTTTNKKLSMPDAPIAPTKSKRTSASSLATASRRVGLPRPPTMEEANMPLKDYLMMMATEQAGIFEERALQRVEVLRKEAARLRETLQSG